MFTRVRNTLFAGAAVFALTACEGDTTFTPQDPALSVADIEGTYMATEAGWTHGTDAGVHYDLIGTGGTYEMVILGDGTYTTRVHRDGFEDIVTTGTLALNEQGQMSVTHDGATRPIEYTWQDGTLTWTDVGSQWEFDGETGMEGARFQGTFTRQ